MDSRLRLVFVLLCCLVVGIALTAFVYYQFYLMEYHEVGVDFLVREREVGFNTDTDALHFGHIPPGGKSWRRMLITPVHDSRLVIRFSGDAAPMIRMDQSVFDAQEDVPLNITFYAQPPKNATVGPYNGTAHFYFYRW